MTRTTAVRLGIPASSLARRILIPTGVVLLLLVAIASLWQVDRVRQKRAFEQRSAVRTVFETSPAVLNGSGGLGTLARNRGFDRIWVLSATGDILDSNQPQEIGHPLDARWWGILKDMPSGLHQDLVAFGNQELTLVSLKAAELGRQVAVVSRPVRAGGPWILNTLGILGLSLILWGGLALLVAGILQRRVEAPTKRLDDKAMDLVRGASLSEASLDRLHAEIAAPLDGHADCMVDLARLLMQRSRQADAASLRWSALFDALPIPAFILDANHRVSEANESLLRWMSVDANWLVGRDLAIMADRVPVERLQAWLNQPATAAIGVRRWQWTPPSESPDSNLLVTVSPMPAGSGMGHLVLIEPVEDLGLGVDAETGASTTTAPKTEAASTRSNAHSLDGDIPGGDGADETVLQPTDSRGPSSDAGSTPASTGRRIPKDQAQGSEAVADEISEEESSEEHSSGSATSTPLRRSAIRKRRAANMVGETVSESGPAESLSDNVGSTGDGHASKPPSITPGIDPSLTSPEATRQRVTAPKAPKRVSEPESADTIISVPAADIMDATGMAVAIFDEEARTMVWTPRMVGLTGLTRSEVVDLKTFTQRIFPHEKERNLFRQWLDADPEERPQSLKINTPSGIKSLVWHASELKHPDLGELGLLWTRIDP